MEDEITAVFTLQEQWFALRGSDYLLSHVSEHKNTLKHWNMTLKHKKKELFCTQIKTCEKKIRPHIVFTVNTDKDKKMMRASLRSQTLICTSVYECTHLNPCSVYTMQVLKLFTRLEPEEPLSSCLSGLYSKIKTSYSCIYSGKENQTM